MVYLALTSTNIHTTLVETCSKTVLKQTFYNFPLYDGVSVVRFVCKIGNRTIRGMVQEKNKAKATFDKSVAGGKTAGLLTQSLHAADVFSTMLGNIPKGKKIHVQITYVGEHKHDAESDGIRLTVPTKITPRYGHPIYNSGSGGQVRDQGRVNITVDASMAESISSVTSPSHKIDVKLGTQPTAAGAKNHMGQGYGELCDSASYSCRRFRLDDPCEACRQTESYPPKTSVDQKSSSPDGDSCSQV